MFFQVPDADRRLARSPHELAMSNLLIFNLLALIALLGGSFLQGDSPLAPYRWLGVALPLGLSLAIAAYTLVRARRAAEAEHWFVAAHWRLAVRRYRVLSLVYLGGAGLIGLGWLLAHTQDKPGMQEHDVYCAPAGRHRTPVDRADDHRHVGVRGALSGRARGGSRLAGQGLPAPRRPAGIDRQALSAALAPDPAPARSCATLARQVPIRPRPVPPFRHS